MKIKIDFITNSSSSAFVVIIPNNFYTNEEEIKELYDYENDMYDSYEEAKADEAFDELHDCIEDLKDGDNIWCYNGEGVNSTLYNILLELCSDHNFILASLNMNGEGNNIIQGVKEEKIEEMLINNIDILSMFKSIQRETENDTSKDK